MCCVIIVCVVYASLRLRGLQPSNSFVHGTLQARILEWVAISSSRGSSPPRDPRVFIGRTDLEAETPTLWPPDAKS